MNSKEISQNSKKRTHFGGATVWFVFLAAVAAAIFFLYTQAGAVISPASQPSVTVTQPAPAEIKEGQWELVLVNWEYSLPTDWNPQLTLLSSGEQIDERVYPYLQKMFDDARGQGVFPVVSSGYRTQETQQKLYDEEIAKYRAQGYGEQEAIEKASGWVALPGTSEHQLGLAADINADTLRSSSEEVYQWLAENSWRYGFILRYPQDKVAITKIEYEPWHFRYVGKEAAKEMYESGLCLEEYLAKKG